MFHNIIIGKRREMYNSSKSYVFEQGCSPIPEYLCTKQIDAT